MIAESEHMTVFKRLKDKAFKELDHRLYARYTIEKAILEKIGGKCYWELADNPEIQYWIGRTLINSFATANVVYSENAAIDENLRPSFDYINGEVDELIDIKSDMLELDLLDYLYILKLAEGKIKRETLRANGEL